MDSKLELFLNKINLPKEDYNYFNEGKILKIKSTKDKLNWDFIIETKELLPIKVLEYLDENIKKGKVSHNDNLQKIQNIKEYKKYLKKLKKELGKDADVRLDTMVPEFNPNKKIYANKKK